MEILPILQPSPGSPSYLEDARPHVRDGVSRHGKTRFAHDAFQPGFVATGDVHERQAGETSERFEDVPLVGRFRRVSVRDKRTIDVRGDEDWLHGETEV